jgi:hypothetical protein
MKPRKSSAYLIVSSAHIGISEDIVNVFSQAAKCFGAKVIHLGPTATDQEITLYKKFKKNLSAAKSMAFSTSRQEDAIVNKIETIDLSIKALLSEEKSRIAALTKAFGKVDFVSTDELRLAQPTVAGAKYVDGSVELSKYLVLSPVPPGSVRATSAPITKISVAYLRELGKSWIVAHPVPAVANLPKPGLNEAYNYYTVGCLKHAFAPTHTRNQYQFAHMPCAILILVDKDNGEFHARQLHIDYQESKSGVKSKPMILDDGLVITESGWKEVPSEDRGTAAFDYHAPWQHAGVVGAHRLLNTLLRPYWLIDGGDTADFTSICPHADGRPGETESLRLMNDINALRNLLSAVANVDSIKKKVLIDSNHHEWLTQFVMKNPALIGMCDWKSLSRDMFADWEVYLREAGDNRIMWFGDIAIRHGDKDGGAQRAESIFQHGKYLCGHWHRYLAYRRSIQIGCGARLGPKYIGNQVTAWQNQIASLTKYNGIGAVSPKVIIHDKAKPVSRFAYRGKIYEADHYHIPAA